MGVDPVHEPGSAVKVSPSCGRPDIVGATSFRGDLADVVTTSSGGACPSRLETAIASLLEDVRTTLTSPLPRTSGVTSRDTHAPAAAASVESTISSGIAGESSHVTSLSLHE